MGSIRINERQQKKVSAEGADEALLADAAAAAAAKPALPPNKKLAYMLDLKTIVISARAIDALCLGLLCLFRIHAHLVILFLLLFSGSGDEQPDRDGGPRC